MLILSPDVEKKVIDYIISSHRIPYYASNQGIFNFSLHLNDLLKAQSFVNQSDTQTLHDLDPNNYLSILEQVLDRICETAINKIYFCESSFYLLFKAYEEGTVAEQQRADKVLEKLFTIGQIESLIFATGGYEIPPIFSKKIAPWLSESQNLKYIRIDSSGDLGSNDVAAEELLRALIKNKSCQRVGLQFNSLTDSIIPSLCELLNKNQLEKINLQNNDFSDQRIRELLLSILTNKTLQQVNLTDDAASEELNAITTYETNMLVNLLKCVKENFKLYVNNQFLDEDKEPDLLTEYKLYPQTIKHLCLDIEQKGDAAQKEQSDMVFKQLLLNENIKRITFESCGNTNHVLVNKIAAYIDHSTTLENLEITNDILTAEDIKLLVNALIKNSNCTKLCLRSNSIDDSAVPFIVELLNKNQIVELDLSNNEFTDEGIHALLNAMKNNGTLEKVNLQNDNHHSAMPSIVARKNLQLLRFINDRLTIKIYPNEFYWTSKLFDSRPSQKTPLTPSADSNNNCGPELKKRKLI